MIPESIKPYHQRVSEAGTAFENHRANRELALKAGAIMQIPYSQTVAQFDAESVKLLKEYQKAQGELDNAVKNLTSQAS